MAKFKYIYFSIFLLSLCFDSFSQFNDKQKAEIQKKSRKIILEYEERLNKLGKEVKSLSKTKVNIGDFLDLFVSRKTQVFNDLDPNYSLSEYYEAETYVNNVALWYPSGIMIKILFDDAQVSNIISHGEDVYSIDFIIEKSIAGRYLNKTENINREKLKFKVGFTISAGELINFKIAGIRKSSFNENIAESKQILELKSFNFTEKERLEIDRETRTVLNDYANYLSLIGDTLENIEEKIMYKSSFKSLFTSEHSMIFNDILVESRKQFVAVVDYITLYSEAYASDGGTVRFQLDSADLGYIIAKNDTVFYRNIKVDKSFSGNYLGKKKVFVNNRISLRLVFERSGREFKKFRIDRIDQVIEKKPEKTEPITFTRIIQKKSVPVSTEKIRISAGFVLLTGNINNANIEEVSENISGYSWKTSPQLGYKAFGHYTFLISQYGGMLTGIGYSVYSTNYFVNTANYPNQNNTQYHDANGRLYYKRISAKIDSTVNLNFIDIPVGLYFRFPVSEKINLFVQPIVNFGILSKANSSCTANREYYMEYPYDLDIIKNIPWPELLLKRDDWLEFGTYKYSYENNKDIKNALSFMQLSADLSAGINFYISKKVDLSIFGNFQYGLTDLDKTQDNYLDFIAETETNSTDERIIYGQSVTNKNKIENNIYQHKATRIIGLGGGIEFSVKF